MQNEHFRTADIINNVALKEPLAPRPAAKFEHAKPELNPLAPRIGERNREILAELGYDNAAIDDLHDARVVGAKLG